MILEVRGGSLVASMATFLLAAGTKGYRSIDHNSLVVIHAISRGEACLSFLPNVTTEEDKLNNLLIRTLATVYSELTGRPIRVTLQWLECGKEQVGNGALAVGLGLADHIR